MFRNETLGKFAKFGHHGAIYKGTLHENPLGGGADSPNSNRVNPSGAGIRGKWGKAGYLHMDRPWPVLYWLLLSAGNYA